MRSLRRGGRRSRPRVGPPLTALVLCAASLALAAPAQADTATATGTSTGAATSTGTVAGPGTGDGTAKPRIIGGRPTESLFKPWIVQLIYQPGTASAEFCGGTAISPTKILTAGHCVAGRDWARHGMVVVGSATTGPSPASTEMKVHAQWLAPGYRPTASGLTVDNDLAILTLDRPVSVHFRAYGWQSPLPGSGAGAGPVTVYGWGNTDSTPGSSNQGVSLQRIDVDGVPDRTCADVLATATGDPQAFVPGHMLCVGAGGTGDDTTGRTACVGDEGDPVVETPNGLLVGVISHLGVRTSTQDCNVPGTYDVVTNFGNYVADVAAQLSNSDVTRDGKADILARTPAGRSYLYASTGTGYKSRVAAPISLSNYDTVVQDDFDRDGHQDFVLRAKGTGNVFLARRSVNSATYKYTRIGSHWGGVKAIVSRSSLGYADSLPHLLVEDSSGRLWSYGILWNGSFQKPTPLHGNWQRYNAVVGRGDFTGDTKGDVLARDARTGNLYLLPGTIANPTIPYLPPLLISGGWNRYDKLISPGDYDGDGHPDLLARVPSGSLYLFRGTGRTGSETLAAPVRIGAGWNAYNGLS
ncbi:trypsin-like serine protease [Streptomyces sp. NPDC047042]|uniref:trypsin-like serine protease n=1 Tax=Streptomyces sp. NPDC047042 TaxID=3154807 RepID=UPI0034087658